MKKSSYFGYWHQILFIISLGVLTASYFFQYAQNLQPCPLCLMQRFCVIGLLLMFFLGIFTKKSRRQYTLIILEVLVALAGLYFASRQLWLQSLPPSQLPACLPGMDILIRYFPLKDIIHAMIFGAADCGEVKWQWLGLTMPGWCAIYFVCIICASSISCYFVSKYGNKA